jgi:phytoene synthase
LLPNHRRRGQVLLPLDILSATGLDRDALLAGEDKARISAAIDAFASLGMEHLAKARQAGPIPAPVFPAFLPLASTEAILKRAARMGAAALEAGISDPQWRRQLRMLKAVMTKRF